MAQKDFTVEGRQFRTQSDYARALHDKKIMDRLRKETDLENRQQLEKLKKDVQSGKYRFMSLLEQDFQDEIDRYIQAIEDKRSKNVDVYVQQELRKKEWRRRLIILGCSLVAIVSLGYTGWYFRNNQRADDYDEMRAMRDRPYAYDPEPTPQYTLDETPTQREVLPKYKKLLNEYENLIGWVKIDDTIIDYPVMQTTDNEYYLSHDVNGDYNNNGTIFLDTNCDVVTPSTNLILYGHHMQSGKMFAQLERYEKESYWRNHQYIQFDTIYEESTWQVMYVFRSRVYKQEEIVFKYYQFIDVNSEQEFDSNMAEMAAMSLYDTGVTAQYGDQLLTLSTCDYEETNGRFVVVAKKVADAKE